MHVGSINIKRKKTSEPEIAGNPAADYDGAWKDGWKQKFHQFLNAYFPHIACQIDWAQSIVWLDKEIECGYTADDIREAYGLIDHMMMLSDILRTQLNQEIKEYEEKFTMPYVTSIEQEGIEKVAVKMILGGKSDPEIAEFTELALNLIQKLRRQLEDSDKPSGE